MSRSIRVRFAPSPTGFMHLGNVRAALMNYLFAYQKKGTFILRIEDTDAQRNLDEARVKLLQDLQWLGLAYTEGPEKGGAYAPYLQSERTSLYQEQLEELVKWGKAYRCFCTPQMLEEKRERQRALGKPPRYDRTCLHFSQDKIDLKIQAGTPFIWRFMINELAQITINDMAHGAIVFEMKNFSDFALTRQDGSFTFMFANFVDDWLMEISHVIRGQDHLSNTAMQAAMYDAFALKLPVFWHLPIICNAAGEKLSKRDFGFSLDDLRTAGFLPEAINGYLAALGHSSEHELDAIFDVARSFNFDGMHAAGNIRYDLDKLTWINHKWISKLSIDDLCGRVIDLVYQEIPESKQLDRVALCNLIDKVKDGMKTLNDAPGLVAFFFRHPTITAEALVAQLGSDHAAIAISLIKAHAGDAYQHDVFVVSIKDQAKVQGLSVKEIFSTVRYVLTGQFDGMGIGELVELLGAQQVAQRLAKVNSLAM